MAPMKLEWFQTPIVMVGDGPINLKEFNKFKGLPIVAVDGGANFLSQMGLEFELIAGDMDSVVPKLLTQISPLKILRLDDQNHCDFEKVLGALEAPKIYAFGFLGGRMDHSIEALSLLSKNHEKAIELIGKEERAFVWNSGENLEFQKGQNLSFMSHGICNIKSCSGLKYSLENLIISPDYTSLSNESNDNQISISYQGAPLIALVQH